MDHPFGASLTTRLTGIQGVARDAHRAKMIKTLKRDNQPRTDFLGRAEPTYKGGLTVLDP